MVSIENRRQWVALSAADVRVKSGPGGLGAVGLNIDALLKKRERSL